MISPFNQLTQSIASLCRRFLMEEKWLIAPSRRIGHQWLEAVSSYGQPAANIHVKTLRGAVLELVGREMSKNGHKLISDQNSEIFIIRILNRLKKKNQGYLTSLNHSPGLYTKIHSSIKSLRLAGILGPSQINAADFEVTDKGKEMALILEHYLRELEAGKWIDYAGALVRAIKILQNDQAFLEADDILMLIPEDAYLSYMEEKFVEAFPEARRKILPVDQPATAKKDLPAAKTDAGLLRWVRLPAKAGEPFFDGTVRISHAVGEINEVREVFRRCLAEDLRFDEVELLHTDPETYIPLIYETAIRLASDIDNVGAEPPVTFAEGIPSIYSRPGRALYAWLKWMREDYSQSTLVKMIQDGLLEITGEKDETPGFAELAGWLKQVRIGFGQDRYKKKLNAKIAALEKRAKPEHCQTDEAGDVRKADIIRQLDGLKMLLGTTERLLEISREFGSDPLNTLDAAEKFITELARKKNEFDNYVQKRFRDEIGELRGLLNSEDKSLGIDMREWLEALPHRAAVEGKGPRPGCIHVAHIANGGHSGRGYTFIVGLDDGRFPGSNLQDPLLLDAERRRLSDGLRTSYKLIERKLLSFAELLARLRGSVSLSFCNLDLIDDREMFPSPVLMDVFRIVSGKKEADQAELAGWLGAPASFAPSSAGSCLEESEWWLWSMCGPEAIKNPEEVITQHFPHLGRGFEAEKERSGERFTVFDGKVIQAGVDLDPFMSGAAPMSASRLETIGRCPLAYFFKHILKLEPPEDIEVSPERWLDGKSLGTLMHDAYYRFMDELQKAERTPNFDRDRDRLEKIVDKCIKRQQEIFPPPCDSVLDRERELMMQSARIFLRDEQEHCSGSAPLYLESEIGMSGRKRRTEMDSEEPVVLSLPGGKRIRVRGRIDRIDKLAGEGSLFAAWDYKTGSSKKYEISDDPFRQGRVVQHALYREIVEARLKEISSRDARLDYFGFFFPVPRERGRRIKYTQDQLVHGKLVIERLCQIVANGAFLPTDDDKDCKYCEFKIICRDTGTVAANSGLKLGNVENASLEPFQELRGNGKKDKS